MIRRSATQTAHDTKVFAGVVFVFSLAVVIRGVGQLFDAWMQALGDDR